MKVSGISWSMLLVVTAMSGGCKTKDPVGVLSRNIRSLGYIPYTTPLEFSGTGTLLGGRPSALQVVAPPQSCFPDSVEGLPSSLRFVDNSSLGSRTYYLSVSGGARFSLLNFLNFANGLGSIGAKFDDVTTMHLEMSGVTIEYFDSVRLASFYRASMTDICKDFLDQVAFVIQALRVFKMQFRFENSRGRLINLQTNIPTNYINVGADYDYRVVNQYALEITSPKYIGYQLGRLARTDKGLALYRASTTGKKDNFEFVSLNLFPDLIGASSTGTVRALPERTSTQQLIFEGHLPQDFKRPW